MEAEVALGHPLPPKPRKFKPIRFIRLAWRAVRRNRNRHMVLLLPAALTLAYPMLYQALVPGLGAALWGGSDDAAALTKLSVLMCVVGALCAPIFGAIMDSNGVEYVLGVMAAFSAITCMLLGLPNWAVQGCIAAGISMVVVTSSTVVARYWALSAPPRYFGTVMGCYRAVEVPLIVICMMGGVGGVGLFPAGLSAYCIPIRMLGVVVTAALLSYIAYIQNYPWPEVPPPDPQERYMRDGLEPPKQMAAAILDYDPRGVVPPRSSSERALNQNRAKVLSREQNVNRKVNQAVKAWGNGRDYP